MPKKGAIHPAVVAADGSGNRWTTRYEDLRRGASSASASTGGSWGLALFVRQGLAAWMRAWPEPMADGPPSHPRPSLPCVPSPVLSTSISGQLVNVLANMVFTARQEVFA